MSAGTYQVPHFVADAEGMDASTVHAGLAPAPAAAAPAELDDLDLCEALYWLRRARGRQDPIMIDIWTERMNDLLDRRLAA
jgi:hypothetical protein